MNEWMKERKKEWKKMRSENYEKYVHCLLCDPITYPCPDFDGYLANPPCGCGSFALQYIGNLLNFSPPALRGDTVHGLCHFPQLCLIKNIAFCSWNAFILF